MKCLSLAILLIAIIGCSAPDPTGTTSTNRRLGGNWDGHYTLTYYFDTDSAYYREIDVSFEFTDSSFKYTGSDFDLTPCWTAGAGSYYIDGHELHLHDQMGRNDYCVWENILDGDFEFEFNQNGNMVSITGKKYVYHYQVDLTRTSN